MTPLLIFAGLFAVARLCLAATSRATRLVLLATVMSLALIVALRVQATGKTPTRLDSLQRADDAIVQAESVYRDSLNILTQTAG